MNRLRIPALIDLMRVSDPALIADLAQDRRLDRQYVSRGPLLNRILTGRIRRVPEPERQAASVGRAAWD